MDRPIPTISSRSPLTLGSDRMSDDAKFILGFG